MGNNTSYECTENDISQNMNIKYWPVTEAFIYPESVLLQDKEDVGIAVSGGGVRAAVLAIGWLQVFHELGYLSKVKYVSSISGGSWTSAPMSNYEGNLDTFLGKIIPPEECSVQRLNEFANQDGSHAKLMTDARFNIYMISDYLRKLIYSPFSLIFHNDDEVDFWAKSVGSCFFEPHGISTTDMGGLKHRSDIPYPIVNGSILVGGTRKAIPVEFTPMYHGTPAPFEANFIDAVYVEPVGFKALVQKKQLSNFLPLSYKQNNCQGLSVSMQVTKRISALNCHEISGISSSALAQEFSGITSTNVYLPHFVYDFFDFPEKQFFSNGVQRFVDGANTDNTGVLALIRRNCTKIAACLANGNPINGDDITSEAANTMGSLAGLFGAQKNDMISTDANDAINEQRQVFETNKWNELVEALRKKVAQGK